MDVLGSKGTPWTKHNLLSLVGMLLKFNSNVIHNCSNKLGFLDFFTLKYHLISFGPNVINQGAERKLNHWSYYGIYLGYE